MQKTMSSDLLDVLLPYDFAEKEIQLDRVGMVTPEVAAWLNAESLMFQCGEIREGLRFQEYTAVNGNGAMLIVLDIELEQEFASAQSRMDNSCGMLPFPYGYLRKQPVGHMLPFCSLQVVAILSI